MCRGGGAQGVSVYFVETKRVVGLDKFLTEQMYALSIEENCFNSMLALPSFDTFISLFHIHSSDKHIIVINANMGMVKGVTYLYPARGPVHKRCSHISFSVNPFPSLVHACPLFAQTPQAQN